MTLEEIKTAVRAGRTVHWANPGYVVVRHVFPDGQEQWLIQCLANNHCIGLTWADETTLNGKPDEFFTAQ